MGLVSFRALLLCLVVCGISVAFWLPTVRGDIPPFTGYETVTTDQDRYTPRTGTSMYVIGQGFASGYRFRVRIGFQVLPMSPSIQIASKEVIVGGNGNFVCEIPVRITWPPGQYYLIVTPPSHYSPTYARTMFIVGI